MKLTKKQTNKLIEEIATELEEVISFRLEWQTPQIALDENVKLYNKLAIKILELLAKKYK